MFLHTHRSTLFPYTTLFRSANGYRSADPSAPGHVWRRGRLSRSTVVARASDIRPWRCIHLRSEEHTSELQSQSNLVCRLLLEKKNSILEQELKGLQKQIEEV